MKSSIFVIEDDGALQELYNFSLENEFECRCFNDGGEFFSAINTENVLPDLVILDIMLPGEDDGFAILSKIKSDGKTMHIPVIMVSAKGDELSKVRGLNMGADDYISKPFGVMELVARIRANLRKNTKPALQKIKYKDIVIDLSKHTVTVNDSSVKTTLKEFNLLCLLCKNAETIQTRENIFSVVWEERFMLETRTLDIHIKELRKKLSEAKSETIIQTVRGVGYMIV